MGEEKGKRPRRARAGPAQGGVGRYLVLLEEEGVEHNGLREPVHAPVSDAEEQVVTRLPCDDGDVLGRGRVKGEGVQGPAAELAFHTGGGAMAKSPSPPPPSPLLRARQW